MGLCHLLHADAAAIKLESVESHPICGSPPISDMGQFFKEGRKEERKRKNSAQSNF